MAYDPLSRSTRVARTTFLVIGTTAAVAWGFGIELKELESVDIPHPKHTMNAVLFIATAYTFIAFLVAYLDDLRHMGDPPLEQMRQDGLEKRRQELFQLRDEIAKGEVGSVRFSEILAEPGLLDELGVLRNLYSAMEADGTDKQGAWNRCRAKVGKVILKDLKRIDTEKRSRPSDRWSWSWLRLYPFDLGVPLLVLVAAILGWTGWLARQLEPFLETGPPSP